MGYPVIYSLECPTKHRMVIQWYIPWDTPWDSIEVSPCPALTSGSYNCGLPVFSCLVLDGLTSFSVFGAGTETRT
jgi:hypothetical protein